MAVEFDDFSFSRFGFIVRTDRITEADDRYTQRLPWASVINNTKQNQYDSFLCFI